jgi:hypothetical protein
MYASGRRFLLSVSVMLSASGCVQPGAGPSPGPSGGTDDRRSRAVAAYQANNICIARVHQAVLAGVSDVERARITQECLARTGAPQSPIIANWQSGIDYEHAGRYAEAAAAFQKTLDIEGYPNGDGLIAGEWLGYLYANGHGVQRNVAKARELFSASDSQNYQTDIALLDHQMLPKNPEGKTPELIAQLSAITQKEVEQMVARWRQDNPAGSQRGYGSQGTSRSTCNHLLAGGHEAIAGMGGCNPLGY